LVDLFLDFKTFLKKYLFTLNYYFFIYFKPF
jgi:hypothetical protein